MFLLAVLILVALTGPASAEPISLAILSALSIAATKTAVAVTSFLLATAFSIATSFAQKALTPRPKKETPTNLDQGTNITTREALAPRRIVYGKTRLGGTVAFIGASNNNSLLHMIIVFCEGPIDAFETIYFNDVPVTVEGGLVTTAPYGVNGLYYAALDTFLGTETQPVESAMLTYFPGQWTEQHRLRGCAYMYVRLQWDTNVFSTGLPNVSAVIRGQKVYDPRTGTTAWSNNAALCIRDYLLRPFNMGGVGASPDEIDEDNFVTQANICDELVTLGTGGTERRYTLNGVLQMDSANSPQTTLEAMLTSCAGMMPWTGGVFYLLVGAWRTPTATITDDVLIGPLKVQPRRALREQFNAIKGSFVNPAARYEGADYPAITSTVFEEEDGGVQIFREFTLEYTQSAAMAQRIAKIELYRSREPISIQAVCNLYAYQIAVGDVVNFTHPRYGWENKAFEVTSWRWTVATTDSAPSLAIELSLRETSAAVYDWNATEEQLLAAAPATSLPNWTNVGGILSLTLAAGSTELILAGDGTIVARIKASWTASVDAFVTQYEVRWRKNTDPTFGVSVKLGRDEAPVYYISPVTEGDIYVVEVRALSLIGATSDWVSGTVLVVGKTDKPADITEVRVSNGVLSWDYPNPPADLGGFQVRYQTGTYAFWPSGTPAHSGLLTSGQFDAAALLAGTITFMVKAVDTSGNESENAAVVVANLGDYIADNVVLDYDLKAAGFPGTITTGTISGGDLVGASSGLFWPADPLTPFYPPNRALFWPTDTYGAIDWSFTYSPDQDLVGSTMSIRSTIVGTRWSITYREAGPGLFWSGDSAALFWSEPSGSLFWPPDGDFGPWPGTVTTRRTRYDFRFEAVGGAVQPVVSAFDLIFDVPDLVEILGDVVVTSDGTLLPLTKTFRAITAVNLTVQAGLGGAVTARIDSKSPSGVLVTALDAAGAPVNATLDAVVQGY